MDKHSEKNNRDLQHPASRDEVIGRALAGSIRGATGACPPPEQIASLIDGLPQGEERDLLLGHLASCRSCRDSFSAAHRLVRGAEQTAAAAPAPRRWMAPSLLAAAAAVAFLALRLAPGFLQPEHGELAQAPHQAAPQLAQAPAQAPQVAQAPAQAPLVAQAPAQTPRAANRQTPERDRKNLAAGQNAQKPSATLDLLTEEEAAQPAAKSYGFSSRERSDGPIIEVENPTLDAEEGKLTALRIKFAPKAGEGVNLETLKVECLKQKNIDLTLRIKPYAKNDGIYVEKFKMPAGSYHFRVGVGDYQGRFSEKEFTVTVSGSL